ncbi:MAG: CapA family protein [Bradymonadaceae bacterium]|nr:CapA family protein [Lujinxingiaceae bacterium]
MFDIRSKTGFVYVLFVLLLAASCSSNSLAQRGTESDALVEAGAASVGALDQAQSRQLPHGDDNEPVVEAAEPQELESHAQRFAMEPFLMLDEREHRSARDLVIVAVGDVSQPATQWVEATEALAGAVFGPTAKLIESGELAFMNLENPMTHIKPVAKKTYAFNSPPERLEWYIRAGFNMFSLANNHIADSGEEGIVDTVRNVELYAEKLQTSVWHAGAGASPEDAIAARYIRLEGKDVTVAFFSVGFSRSPNVGRFWDERLPEYIAEAREKADIVFVSVHAGREYQHVPDPDMQTRFRSWIDAGADLVVGHHTHCVQPVEQYKQGLIFYSLGNYVFSSRTVRHRKMGARLYGMLTRIVIEDGKLRGAQIVPTWVNNSEDWRLDDGQVMPNANFVPQILTGAFADQFFEDLDDWTMQAGATPVERIGDVGFIRIRPAPEPVSLNW